MVNQTKGSTLLVDIGNSSLKWAILKMGSESNLIRESSNRIGENKFDSDPIFNMQSQQCPENITPAFFTEQWKALDQPLKVVVSCVASEYFWRALLNACNELWNVEVDKVTSLREGFGLTNAYENASDLGSDRWCAMIGGLQIAKSDFLIVDAGSALTIDRVDESGQHLGGYIIPGLNMMKKSLGIDTANIKIDLAADNKASLSLARSTKDCVESGIYLSAVKLIEAVFEKESKQVKDLQCYITGGDAKSLVALLSSKCVIMPDIVLQGLAHIAKTESYNQESLFK